MDLASNPSSRGTSPFELPVRTAPPPRAWFDGWLFFVASLLLATCWNHCSSDCLNADEFSFALPDVDRSVSVSADQITHWQVGHYEVLHLQGSVLVQQQAMTAAANEAILWVETPDATESDVHKIIAYLEDQVVIELPRAGNVHESTGVATDRIVDQQWLGRFFTRQTVDLNRSTEPLGDRQPPAIFQRAQTALAAGAQSDVQATSFTAPIPKALGQVQSQVQSQSQGQLVINPQTGQIQEVLPITPTLQIPNNPLNGLSPLNGNPLNGNPPNSQPWQAEGVSPNAAVPQAFSSVQTFSNPQVSPFASNPQTPSSPFNVQITARDSSSDLNIKSFTNPQNPNERVSIGVGGFRISIDSPDLATAEVFQQDASRQVIMLADNLVQWQFTRPDGSQSRQLYMEGNVVFSKDRRVIYAQRMFYDIDQRQGTILDAEVLTPVPEYEGLVRLKADVVQQVDENNLQAYGSSFTTSRLGVPRYWLQSGSIALNRQPTQALDPITNAPLFDSQSGLPQTEDQYTVESQSNRVYLGGVPVFAWPRFRTNLSDPSLYVDRLGVNNDSIFGFQVTTGFNLYQILGIPKPAGSKWIGIVDYLSERGVGVGSEFEYRRNGLFGVPGQVNGKYESWFIRDGGRDVLGRDRKSLLPEEKNRGRITGRHRHQFSPGYQLKAELGYISDRNFLEQYYEREWDTEKDKTTGLWLERNLGTRSYNLTADLQVNDFFAQTSWLPRYDQFTLGQPLLGDRAVWHGHSHAGYAKLRAADPPTNASELAKFDPLAWEADVDGVRVGTRQELDFPMQVGAWKVVPYVLGDLTYWQEDLTGNDLTRAYGQTGVRASLPVWKSDPSVQSVLWNVNGLAHKVNFDFDAYYADASQDLDELPLYDPLDDDAQEHFRRRFAFDTFGIMPGGNVPLPYDERYFALRSGIMGNVTAPSMEIADDMTAVKLGVRQRWQTKRGMPGNERIIDWITLDMQATVFPDAEENNFGSDFGLFDYDFTWHLGDRFSLVSDGYFDFFSQGLRTASFGGNLSRPEIGNAYLGYRMIEGPISSNIITANTTYRMSERWGVKAGGQVDFGETGSIGQSLSFVYIGESFLWQMGLNYDVSRDNLGFRFGFEPRFNPRSSIFRPGGQSLPPASARYLE